MVRVLALATDVSVLGTTLLGAGHDLICTRDRDAAIRLLGELKPQIVLGDSDLDGVDFCWRVRDAGHKVYFLLVSGPATCSDPHPQAAAGVDDWIAKPLTSRVILECIERGLQVVSRRVGAV